MIDYNLHANKLILIPITIKKRFYYYCMPQ